MLFLKGGSHGKRAVLSTLSGEAKAQATINYMFLTITYETRKFQEKIY